MKNRNGMLCVVLLVVTAAPAFSQSPSAKPVAQGSSATVRVAGTVRDEAHALPLPGIPVEIVDTKQTTYTDVDGRYVIDVAPGQHEIKVMMEGYQTKTLKVTTGQERMIVADVGLVMTRFAEAVTVVGQAIDVETSSAEAQLTERKNAPIITDNVGSQEMKQNGDSDAAAAMSRVTGMSLVDNQYVFVRGLGERYSNTTLGGAVIPTTEPDKKVVPLDLFPSGLIDSVQVAKSYTPDKSAEFAGGLVQIVPMKYPNQPVFDLSYGINRYSTATGKNIPLSPLGNRDAWGYDGGARALPAGMPADKIVRRGLFTPNVGYSPDEITGFGRLLGNVWRPQAAKGMPGQNWGLALGNRFGKLGVVASVSHAYKEQYVEEQRNFYRVGAGSGATAELDPISEYAMQYGTQKAQLGVVGNVAYQFSSNHRLSVENFYTHSGRDEGRSFEGDNFENQFRYRNYRLQFIEEELMSNGVSGDHFFQGLSNSKLDWRVSVGRATRDEPDLREVLQQGTLGNPATSYVLADESQSGFRMFNNLNDDTTDAAVNWSIFKITGRPTQFKFGVSYIERTRDFVSRRFRFIPVVLTKDGPALANLSLTPEELYTASHVGTAFRFNEETRPTDAYDGRQTTSSGYGMFDVALSGRSRLIAGARVERFDQKVSTFDPFGLFVRRISAENNNTDVFPAVNFVQALSPSTNLRLGYSTTVNRPEFRELAEFEFTDVVGNRAIKGNPNLDRARVHNVDGRWEVFAGGRGILAASVFYKYFDKPIERVVIAAANPIVTFQNSDNARNVGVELEAGRQIGKYLFLNANYTFVESKITLLPEQLGVQTSLERALAGQSKNLFNLTAELAARGFSTRVLYNYFGDRISDVGANDAPDILEQGRGALDLVFSQRVRGLGIRLTLENLADSDYLFTQGTENQRLFKLGRTIALSFGYNLF